MEHTIKRTGAALLFFLLGCSPRSPAPATTPSPSSDLAALRREATQHPQDARAQARYGSALAEAGDIKSGIVRLRRAVALDPGLTAAWHNLALSAEGQGWLDIAADAYGHVVAAKPGHAGEWIKLGYVLIALGRYDEAERAFTRAVDLQPNASDSLVALASSRYAAFRFDDALVALKRASAVNPRSAAAQVNAALIYLERSRPADAEAAIRAALQIEPDRPRYHVILGRILALSPDAVKRTAAAAELGQALSTGESALSPTEKAEAEHALGVLARDAGRTDEAMAHWQNALTNDPLRADTRLALGHALARQPGGATESRRLLKEFERLQSQRDRERKLRQRAEERPHDGAVRRTFGMLLAEMGNLPRAVWELHEAVRLLPQDPLARGALADVLCRQGRDDEAAALLLSAPRWLPPR